MTATNHPVKASRVGSASVLTEVHIGERHDYAPPNLVRISCHLWLTFADGAGFSVPAGWLRELLNREAKNF